MLAFDGASARTRAHKVLIRSPNLSRVGLSRRLVFEPTEPTRVNAQQRDKTRYNWDTFTFENLFLPVVSRLHWDRLRELRLNNVAPDKIGQELARRAGLEPATF